MQKLAIEYLLKTQERFPHKTAVIEGNQSMTFSQLWQRSLLLAHWIQESFPAANRPIVISLPKSIDAVVALLGIQLSGNIYVPFDVDTPTKRKEKILASLGSCMILEKRADQLTLADKVFRLEETADKTSLAVLEKQVMEKLSGRSGRDSLYIIFTSGTTGTPKGVNISNGSVIDYIDWAATTYQVSEHEVIGCQAPFFFDNSVLDLYLTFAKGCTLHLLSKEVLQFPTNLAETIQSKKINFIFFVPSILGNWIALDIFDHYNLSCLKKVLFAGEPMPLSLLKHLKARLPTALLSNLYGPTEVTVDAVYQIFGDEVETLTATPIGIPCSNHRVIFLDENAKPVTAEDQAAEICIAGPGVALGYWNNPEETRRAFVRNPEASSEIIYKTGDYGYKSSTDGLIYMTGRKDGQFKHLGYRIESGEIEKALEQLDGVNQSCILYDSERKLILAFYVTGNIDADPPLRSGLSGALPGYMMPHRFIRLERFPLTPNGKVDRRALRQEHVENSNPEKDKALEWNSAK